MEVRSVIKSVMKAVLSRGRVIIDKGVFMGKSGAGEFHRSKAYSEIG
jgi:hypothetical protein